MENLSRKISDILVKKDIIECQNRNFYGYCIEVILLYFINLATIFIWAIFVGKFLECCFLLILISLLRNYCGGIHMNTWYSCYFITCALIGLILSICDEIIIDWYVLVPIYPGILLIMEHFRCTMSTSKSRIGAGYCFEM